MEQESIPKMGIPKNTSVIRVTFFVRKNMVA
jgi:hypothetical protein